MDKLKICVASYKRPTNYFYMNLVKKHPSIADQVVYFVREEELNLYKDAMPLIQYIVPIPTGAVDGIGSTREFIRKCMAETSVDWYTISDDDLTDITLVRYDENRKARYDGKDLVYTLDLIKKTLDTLPDTCVIGTLQHRAFAKDFDVPVKIMSTRSPAGFVFYRNSVIKHIPFDLVRFNKHGDDIGYACKIVSLGLDYFQLPPVVYSFYDSGLNSTLRTKDNYRELFDRDYENAKFYLPEQCLGRSKNMYHFTYIKPKEVLKWRKQNEHCN